MSTTVTYKGSTLTTVNNETKSLLTKGTWLEDDIEITDESSGSSGTALIVDTTDSHGGIIREITTDTEVKLEGAKTVTPTSSQQTITPSQGYDGFSGVIVNAMPSGTAGTPTATKGTVSNHSVSVTPSVTNTTGYITGGTKTGTAVAVSASELVSGTKSITDNGTGIDVANYASVDVNVSSGSTYTATLINSSGSYSSNYVVYEGTKYYSVNSTFTFSAGDTATFGGSDIRVYEDNVRISESGISTYAYTLPPCNIEIVLKNVNSPTAFYAEQRITTAVLTITENGTGINVKDYIKVNVDVPDNYAGLKVIPSSSTQIFNPDSILNVSKTTADYASDAVDIGGMYYYISGYTSYDVLPLVEGNTYHVTGTWTYAYTGLTYSIDEYMVYNGEGSSFKAVPSSDVIRTFYFEKSSIDSTLDYPVLRTPTLGDYMVGYEESPLTLNISADAFSTVTVTADNKNTVTMTGSAWNSTYRYITYNGTKYNSPTSFTFSAGDTIGIHIFGYNGSGSLTINGEIVTTVPTGSSLDYNYTLPAGNIELYAPSNDMVLNTEYVAPTGTYNINADGVYNVKNYANVDVDIQSKRTLTITGTGNSTNTYIMYKGTKYYNPTSFSFDSGDSIDMHLRGGGDDGWRAIATVNGAKLCYQEAAYNGSFVLPDADVTVSLEYDTSYSRNTISIIYSLPGSSYTPISVGSLEVTANVTSTSSTVIDSKNIDISSLSVGDLLYIKIRDKAGKRNGYFYGTDMYFVWGNSTRHPYTSARTYRYNNDTLYSYTTGNGTVYGIGFTEIGSSGEMPIRGRYNSTYSLTINGTYSIDVYKLNWPEGISPFIE